MYNNTSYRRRAIEAIQNLRPEKPGGVCDFGFMESKGGLNVNKDAPCVASIFTRIAYIESIFHWTNNSDPLTRSWLDFLTSPKSPWFSFLKTQMDGGPDQNPDFYWNHGFVIHNLDVDSCALLSFLQAIRAMTELPNGRGRFRVWKTLVDSGVDPAFAFYASPLYSTLQERLEEGALFGMGHWPLDYWATGREEIANFMAGKIVEPGMPRTYPRDSNKIFGQGSPSFRLQVFNPYIVEAVGLGKTETVGRWSSSVITEAANPFDLETYARLVKEIQDEYFKSQYIR